MNSEKLYHYLKQNHSGRKNAALSKELEAVFLCKGSEIRKHINELRANTIPVCSSGLGYYYSENTDDIDETVAHLNSRISKIELARNGLLKVKNQILSRKEDHDGKKNRPDN